MKGDRNMKTKMTQRCRLQSESRTLKSELINRGQKLPYNRPSATLFDIGACSDVVNIWRRLIFNHLAA